MLRQGREEKEDNGEEEEGDEEKEKFREQVIASPCLCSKIHYSTKTDVFLMTWV
jgi:hypothetical protein